MIKKIFMSVLLLILIPIYCYSSTVLYSGEDKVFLDTANVVVNTFNIGEQPIVTSKIDKEQIVPYKQSFFFQLERETEFLYILSHGLPEKGLMISVDERVTGDEIAKHIQADVVIIDSCFSGRLLEQKSGKKKPSLIISSTTEDNYSYNPKIEENYRISMLSVALFTYFCNQEIHEGLENGGGLDLHKYNNRVLNLEQLLKNLKYVHLKLYVNLIAKEEFEIPARQTEDRFGLPFMGFSSIQYGIE